MKVRMAVRIAAAIRTPKFPPYAGNLGLHGY
nr:MAG TPA: hypothetical protein [Caudoviricetes sp.]